jgi:hypothetical protein
MARLLAIILYFVFSSFTHRPIVLLALNSLDVVFMFYSLVSHITTMSCAYANTIRSSLRIFSIPIKITPPIFYSKTELSTVRIVFKQTKHHIFRWICIRLNFGNVKNKFGMFLLNLRSIISYPFWVLLRRSLDEGILPSILKLGSITLVLKSGDPYAVFTFRPIVIQSHIAKLFESLLLKDVHKSINNIIVEKHHGF